MKEIVQLVKVMTSGMHCMYTEGTIGVWNCEWDHSVGEGHDIWNMPHFQQPLGFGIVNEIAWCWRTLMSASRTSHDYNCGAFPYFLCANDLCIFCVPGFCGLEHLLVSFCCLVYITVHLSCWKQGSPPSNPKACCRGSVCSAPLCWTIQVLKWENKKEEDDDYRVMKGTDGNLWDSSQ